MCSNSHSAVNIFGKNYFTKVILVLLLGAVTQSSPTRAQSEAQPELPAVTLTIGNKTVRAEVADDDKERTTGLMFRKSLAPDTGMLFVMPQIAPVAFWMRNTEIPLTIAYIDPTGTILETHDLEPRNEKSVPSQFPNIAYALEMPRSWFSKNNIWCGERVKGLPPGPR
jgi:uncharacterized membrane protein (UPF0127 family)